MESFVPTCDVLFPSLNSVVPAEELREPLVGIDRNVQYILGAQEPAQHSIPDLILPVTSSNSINTARDVSASSAVNQQIPENSSASPNFHSWDSHLLQHCHFQEVVRYPTGSQEMQSSENFNNSTWSSASLDTSGMVSTSFPFRASHARDQLAHPYFRGTPIITPSEQISIGCHTRRRKEPILLPGNFRPITDSQRKEHVSLPSTLVVNETFRLTNSTKIQYANVAQAPVTTGSDDTGTKILFALEQNSPNMIPTHQTQRQASTGSFSLVTKQNMMTGGRMKIVAQSLSEISDIANPIASEPAFSAASVHVMNAPCPSFLGKQTQMKAVLPLTPPADSQSPAPRIPTCSICLDQLVSTIVFPCRHFYCENCAQKIKKCGFCREVIETRHRVYF
ncbi:hypothetical protein GHT06_009519 [Daphnia sinensis]|uniref:RING-type domain-containing protein n=1 Tax=Daphnia sinensis TaxID=1820382 RepID=A0AAD5Q011_9CRUS|nr:hypothetical protein GHT06_009519 [Daphnia sinensis]